MSAGVGGMAWLGGARGGGWGRKRASWVEGLWVLRLACEWRWDRVADTGGNGRQPGLG